MVQESQSQWLGFSGRTEHRDYGRGASKKPPRVCFGKYLPGVPQPSRLSTIDLGYVNSYVGLVLEIELACSEPWRYSGNREIEYLVRDYNKSWRFSRLCLEIQGINTTSIPLDFNSHPQHHLHEHQSRNLILKSTTTTSSIPKQYSRCRSPLSSSLSPLPPSPTPPTLTGPSPTQTPLEALSPLI